MDTPGCTAQACGIRDRLADYEAAGTVVIGVSRDTPEELALGALAELAPSL